VQTSSAGVMGITHYRSSLVYDEKTGPIFLTRHAI
jgi:hypothetical protein